MKTKIIIPSSGVIDLYDDVPISLNYSIADIREPQKRNADYSKTITLPGTNNNNHLLSNVYEIGIDRLYNPNKKVEARILTNGIQVMKGFMRLAKIKTLRDNKIEYDIEIKGRLDDLFTTLGDTKLSDLNWSDLDHLYTRGNIEVSWTNQIGHNYIYPFIDYGYSANGIDYDVTHFLPAIYIKEIWDRVMAFAGFQTSGTIINSTIFKSIAMLTNSDNMTLTTTQVNNRIFRATRENTDQALIVPADPNNYTYFDIIFNDDTTSPNQDIGGVYDVATGIWTCNASGLYNIESVFLLSNSIPANSFTAFARVIDITNNPVQVAIYSGTMTSSINSALLFSSSEINIQSGTQIKVQVAAKSTNGTTLNVLKSGLTTARFLCKSNPIITTGDTITMSNILPQNMKIADWLLAIIKMFNIYLEYDKDTPNLIYCETRNSFYLNTIQDWSDKMEVSKEPEILPMGALNAKRYRFSYKKDGDVLNADYESQNGEIYGERYKDVDNDFLRNHENYESPFSPTPLYSDAISDRVYPAIIYTDAAGLIVHNKTSNPRLIYYGGLINCDIWKFYQTYNSITTFASEIQYPYCGHLDNPTSPTFDLNWGLPREIYYVPAWNATYTNNNLYNAYWRQFIDEITDYNSSIVTAWFWLQPADILEIDFRHIYRFKNQNFRLNKIYDYNPITYQPTKCEFIKIKTGVPFVPQSKTIVGASDGIYSASK